MIRKQENTGEKMKAMKEMIIKTLFVILILFLSIALAKPLLAGTSISGTASCRVPYILTMSDGSVLVAEEETTEQNTNIVEDKENSNLLNAKQAHNSIIQQEEKKSENNEEVEFIYTVCAR